MFVTFIESIPFSRASTHVASACPDGNGIDPRFLSNSLELELMGRRLLALEKLSSANLLSADFMDNG